MLCVVKNTNSDTRFFTLVCFVHFRDDNLFRRRYLFFGGAFCTKNIVIIKRESQLFIVPDKKNIQLIQSRLI